MKKLLLFFALFYCTTCFAGVNKIIFFGDSLSDNGNLYHYIKIPKSPPYFEGRFTNGPTWAENVSKFYYDKYFIDSANYAYGGATAIVHSPIHDKFPAPTTLTAEVDQYLLDTLTTPNPNALYGFWIGANDYLYEYDSNVDYVTNQVVDSITSNIVTLIQKRHAKNFFVMNLPDLSKTPHPEKFGGVQRLYNIAVMHNKKLAVAIDTLRRAYPDVNIVFLDIQTVFTDLLTNTQKYNTRYGTHIKDSTHMCWDGGLFLNRNNNNITAENPTMQYVLSSPDLRDVYSYGKLFNEGMTPCTNADEYVFWDELHPTAAIHQIIAATVEDQLTKDAKNLFG